MNDLLVMKNMKDLRSTGPPDLFNNISPMVSTEKSLLLLKKQ